MSPKPREAVLLLFVLQQKQKGKTSDTRLPSRRSEHRALKPMSYLTTMVAAVLVIIDRTMTTAKEKSVKMPGKEPDPSNSTYALTHKPVSETGGDGELLGLVRFNA
jgi:hypothetical protein